MHFVEHVVNLINEERMKNGLHPLKLNSKLSSIAQVKAEDMYINNYFNHTSPLLSSSFEMLNKSAIQYSCAAENIAKGQRTAQRAVSAWMSSPKHRENILSEKYTETGIGVADAYGIPIWTQLFIG